MSASMQVVPVDRAPLLWIVHGLRERDRREVFACRFDDDAMQLAEDILAAQARAVLSAIVEAPDGEPVAYFGAYLRTPSCVECAAIATDRWPDIVLLLTKWIHRTGLPVLAGAGVRRAEARALIDHVDAQAWMLSLGARIECRIPGFGRNGEEFVQLALDLDEEERLMCFNPPEPQRPPRPPRLADARRASDAERRRRLAAGAARTLLTGPQGVLTTAPARARQLLGQ